MDQKLISKLAYVPMSRPGFDALDMSAPVMVQLNPDGQWENSTPEGLDEDRMKTVVRHLISSKAISAARSYCSQCAAESKAKHGAPSNYVPVIMMPIYPADHCPFDMNCDVQKIKKTEKNSKKNVKATEEPHDSKEDKDKRKSKSRGYTLQRLTDFDLLSQW